MNNMCRVCLSENDEDKLSLDTTIEHQTVADLINFCSGIKVKYIKFSMPNKNIWKNTFRLH